MVNFPGRCKSLSVEFKTSFNHCSSGSGQNSVIPVVCNVPECTQHATLSNYPRTECSLSLE